MVGGYPLEIHEMTEMAAVDFGQCAISNQPCFHIPFLYAEFGQQDKTHQIVKAMVDQLFSAEDGGFPGDEDNGTMAAWYIFALLGLYPMCPGKAEFTVSGGLVRSATLVLDGKQVNLTDKLKGQEKISYFNLMK